MYSPFFSIVIPTHNRPHLLKRALASVAAQHFPDLELIIVNDGSSLPYGNVLEEAGVKAASYIVHETPLGVSAARNAGIKAARGKWVTFLDDDDEYTEGFLANLHQRLVNASDEIGFAWASVVFQHYDAEGKPASRGHRLYADTFPSESVFFESAITVGTGFGLTVKRINFDRIGLFDHNLKLGEDTDLILKLLAANYQAVVLPEPGIIVHGHHAARFNDGVLDRVRRGIFLHLATRHRDIFHRQPAMFVKGLGWGVWASYFCGDFSAGDRLLWKIFVSAPTHPLIWQCVTQNIVARLKFGIFPQKRLVVSQ